MRARESVRWRPAANQAFVPEAVYSQPPTLNIGENPGAGSVRVPVKVATEVIVPRSSIADALPADALMMKSVKPSLSRTVPVSGPTEPAGEVAQLLVVALNLPSDNTSTWVVRTWLSGSDPPVHGRVAVFRKVKDQSPAACV